MAVAGGFFLRPKNANLDRTNNHINAEAIVPSNEGYEAEYTDQTGTAVHKRRHPSEASEVRSGAPLPGGSWRGAVSRTSPSGFGRGSRSGSKRR